MLLSHLGFDHESDEVESAVAADLANRNKANPGSTSEIGERIASAAAQ